MLLLIMANNLFAQLNGVYIIDQTAVSSDKTYNNISSVINDLINGSRNDGGNPNGPGISGPVTFNIMPGIYNGQITLNSITGTSNINTLTFQSSNNDKASVIITYQAAGNSDNWVLKLNNNTNITFKSLSFQAQSADYGRVVVFTGNSENIHFQDNKFISKETNSISSDLSIVYKEKDGNLFKNFFDGNTFFNGACGIYLTGINDFQLTNNVFLNQSYIGIYIHSSFNLRIDKNEIFSDKSIFQNGILIGNSDSIDIAKNQIVSENSSIFKSVTLSSTNFNYPVNICNNSIYSGNTGIWCFGNFQLLKVYFNSVLIKENNDPNSTAIRIPIGNPIIKNNSFVNLGQGTAAEFTGINFQSDYNNLYSNGNSICQNSKFIGFKDLASWIAGSGIDSNSISILPDLFFIKDLHCLNCIGLKDKGISIIDINDDMDGDLRDKKHPDIGSDEFSKINDAGLITGLVFYDSNSNCIRDVNEIAVKNCMIEFTPGPYYTSSDSAGNFKIMLPEGQYSIKTILNNSLKYWTANTCNPSYSNIVLSSDSTVKNINFALSPIPTDIYDINLAIIESRCAKIRRGINHINVISYQNLGTKKIQSCQVKFIADKRLVFDNAIPAPDQISSNEYTWFISNLNPGETRFIKIDQLYPIALSFSDTIKQFAEVKSSMNDIDPSNNYDTISQLIVAAVDPNDKFSDPQKYIYPATKNIDYTVRFQNTGNAHAIRVRVIDTLDISLPITEVVIKGASHPFDLYTNNNVLTWVFENINLADSSTNEPESHGNLRFSAGLQDNLKTGLQVNNTAYIYFDYELPIATNRVSNIVVDDTVSIDKDKNKQGYYKLIRETASGKILMKYSGTSADQLIISNGLGQCIGIIDFKPYDTKVLPDYFSGLILLKSVKFSQSFKLSFIEN
jgi:parallel beta-helix repeat protein